MKLSIITAVYNAQDTIADTIESVQAGGMDNYEHIIVDACSTDNTLRTIHKLRHNRMKVISEPDTGIYDGMNKGIKLSSGTYISTLNADDYYETGVLASISPMISRCSADVIHGNLSYVRDGSSTIHRPPIMSTNYIPVIMPVFHPTTFIKKAVYSKYGLYDTDFKICADQNLMTTLYFDKANFLYVDKVITHMRWGGASVKNWKLQHEEQRRIHDKFQIDPASRRKFNRDCRIGAIRSTIKSIFN